MHITLRPGEKLYLNGAVLRADRKVSLELMNDATFLLEAHVMHAEQATSPMRQLYFIVQMMLMNPLDTKAAAKLFGEMLPRMRSAYADASVLGALMQVEKFVASNRFFEALKQLRSIFAIDDALMVNPRDLAIAS